MISSFPNFSKLDLVAIFLAILFSVSSCQENDSINEIEIEKHAKLEKLKAKFNLQEIPNAVADPENALYFSSIEEMEAYFEKMQTIRKNSLGSVTTNEIPCHLMPVGWDYDCGGHNTGGGTVIRGTVWYGGIWAYRVSFEIDYTGAKWVAKDYKSEMVGFTVGTSWRQTNYDYYTAGNYLCFSVYGIQSYNIFIEGIGTVYRAPVRIDGCYDTDTGNLQLETPVYD